MQTSQIKNYLVDCLGYDYRDIEHKDRNELLELVTDKKDLCNYTETDLTYNS